MKIVIEEGAKIPTRAHPTDAGMDICASENGIIPAHGCKSFKTGVRVEIPHGCAGLLVSKSGLNIKHGVTSTGLIDEGYTGEIIVNLQNNSDNTYWVSAGDKISQLVIIPVVYPTLEITNQLEKTHRGNNGFGSSGK